MKGPSGFLCGPFSPTLDLTLSRPPAAKTSPTDTARLSSGGNGATSVILAVSDTQVQRLFYVMRNADWTLELRPVVNAADSAERIDNLNTVMEGR